MGRDISARRVSKGGYVSGSTPPHKLGPPPASLGAGTIRPEDFARRRDAARILLEEVIYDVGHDDEPNEAPSGTDDPKTAADGGRVFRSLRSTLAPEQIDALKLVLSGRSGTEVATAMGLPPDKVVALLNDAFSALLSDILRDVEADEDASAPPLGG